jgi:hypothetical membrane protein
MCGALILLGPLYAGPGYNATSHTVGDLGAQGAAFGWAMRLGLVMLGVGVALDARRLWWRAPFVSLLFLTLAGAVALSPVFSPRPLHPDMPFSDTAHVLHHAFAAMAGVCLCVGVAGYGFVTGAGRAKAISFAVCAATVLLSLAMILWPDLGGLLQRLMLAAAFAWMVAFLPNPGLLNPSPGTQRR